jgi:aarF domain-containing kinase
MGALHSQGKPHDFKHTKQVIEDVFERPFEELFEEFDETPIGTGAIAQVIFLLKPTWKALKP